MNVEKFWGGERTDEILPGFRNVFNRTTGVFGGLVEDDCRLRVDVLRGIGFRGLALFRSQVAACLHVTGSDFACVKDILFVRVTEKSFVGKLTRFLKTLGKSFGLRVDFIQGHAFRKLTGRFVRISAVGFTERCFRFWERSTFVHAVSQGPCVG
jgi:hypothetical protein